MLVDYTYSGQFNNANYIQENFYDEVVASSTFYTLPNAAIQKKPVSLDPKPQLPSIKGTPTNPYQHEGNSPSAGSLRSILSPKLKIDAQRHVSPSIRLRPMQEEPSLSKLSRRTGNTTTADKAQKEGSVYNVLRVPTYNDDYFPKQIDTAPKPTFFKKMAKMGKGAMAD